MIIIRLYIINSIYCHLLTVGRPTVILALASAIPEQVRLPVAFHNVAERNHGDVRWKKEDVS